MMQFPKTTIAAYVSVVSEPRSVILPNWTVIFGVLWDDDWGIGSTFDYE